MSQSSVEMAVFSSLGTWTQQIVFPVLGPRDPLPALPLGFHGSRLHIGGPLEAQDAHHTSETPGWHQQNPRLVPGRAGGSSPGTQVQGWGSATEKESPPRGSGKAGPTQLK